jgi:hypothetical protein
MKNITRIFILIAVFFINQTAFCQINKNNCPNELSFFANNLPVDGIDWYVPIKYNVKGEFIDLNILKENKDELYIRFKIIETLPNKPGTNIKYTPKKLFDYFRLHINDFAEKFTPVVDINLGVNDIALWNSPNPLGALISIDIPVLGDTVHDDGTVICSGVSSNAWVFTTIRSPWDHAHPVSGNRFLVTMTLME